MCEYECISTVGHLFQSGKCKICGSGFEETKEHGGQMSKAAKSAPSTGRSSTNLKHQLCHRIFLEISG